MQQPNQNKSSKKPRQPMSAAKISVIIVGGIVGVLFGIPLIFGVIYGLIHK